jgi:ionotropic glutamate receptor NMDA 2B
MLAVLERYDWSQFGIVTSHIAGHDDFVRAVRDEVARQQQREK